MNIAVMRNKAGLTQQELADKAGINRVSVTRYETGKRTPDLDTAVKIAEALDCSVDDLVGSCPPLRPDGEADRCGPGV